MKVKPLPARCEECGAVVKEGRRFCSVAHAAPWLDRKALAFASLRAPADGVTYGSGKAPSR